MVIGIGLPERERPGGGRGFSAPTTRPFRPTYSNRLLRRRSGFLGSIGSGFRSVRRGVGSSSAGIGGGIARRFGSSTGGIGSRLRSVSGGVGSLILLGATGAQHEGNRNGA